MLKNQSIPRYLKVTNEFLDLTHLEIYFLTFRRSNNPLANIKQVKRDANFEWMEKP